KRDWSSDVCSSDLRILQWPRNRRLRCLKVMLKLSQQDQSHKESVHYSHFILTLIWKIIKKKCKKLLHKLKLDKLHMLFEIPKSTGSRLKKGILWELPMEKLMVLIKND